MAPALAVTPLVGRHGGHRSARQELRPLSPPVIRGQIRGWFQAGLPVLEACGLVVTVETIIT